MGRGIVIVTGAFGILGKCVADFFESNGDKVARIDYAPVPEGAPGTLLGGVDLTRADAAQRALEQITGELGQPTALVNIAGGFTYETLAEGSPESWSNMFRMNALTAVTMCSVCLPALTSQAGAAIVNVGAAATAKAGAGMGAYTASKSAVKRLTESLAAELAGSDVTVNAVLPTIIDTPSNRKDMPDADVSEWVQPSAIAEVIAFLTSPAARCINGASIELSRGTGPAG